MKDKTQANSSSQFLKTDGGKTKSNAIEIPSIALPKGGGAIKGIDEKFSVNSVNGTASFSIPLPFSPARGASPSLSLSYNSGGGNGIFGLGWNVSFPSIKRKTDKELPQYFDSIDSDTFLFSEAEDLVPVFQKENNGSYSIDIHGDFVIKEKDSPDGLWIIRFYRPRTEGLFARIERWTNKNTKVIRWRVITKDNQTTLFGWSNNSVLSDPANNTRIYEWLPEFVFDDKGNCCQYVYKKEDKKGFDVFVLHNRNRFANGDITYTNIYLEKVLYGNTTPYLQFENTFPDETDYIFQTVFDYGEYDNTSPYHKSKDWDFRPDSFSEYKSGFEVRTTRLCKRVLLFHYFNELPGGSALVKSVDFEYDTSTERDFTFLKSIKNVGYCKKPDESYTKKSLPPVEFEYQKHSWNKEVKYISSENIVHSPSGLDEQQYQFTDLFNEGLAGILTEQASGWYYKHNLGNGNFEHARIVSPKPSFAGLGGQLQLSDLDADGGKQLVRYSGEPRGYFELDDDNEWQRFMEFKNLPTIDFGDPNTRMLDLNGDGKAEVLITEESVFTWYQSEGRDGFSEATRTVKPYDEEAGPAIVFADQKQTIFLADMSGDGLTDIVRIRNGEVCYWSNLGYGKFGTKVAMDNAPLFDFPDSFNPAYLKLADIDGSGTTDIIYLGKNKFSCWMNLSGNSFSPVPFEIEAFPEVNNNAKISITDLLGNGVACIVWSSDLSKNANSPLRYIDLMDSKKPHIMVSYKNNLGKEVSLEYTPSTTFYLEDKLAGKPWVTKLHFPVHCISKTITSDKISGWKFVSSYKYHHGYYDHPEREFRGFGMVEQIDSEHFEHWGKDVGTNILDRELHQEPVVSKSWFHTGAFLRREKILDQFSHEYWYEEMQRHGFSVVHHEVPLPDARIIPAPGLLQSYVDNLNIGELHEALRACKGMALRSEVFANDAPLQNPSSDEIKKQLTPYSVATHNCVIELLQPKGKNKHAVYIVKESESISYSYERNIADPRIAHNLNIALDEYGNVLESAAVVYPRVSQETTLPNETQLEQSKTVVIYTKHKFTNDIIDDNINRLRLPSEVKTYEIKGVARTGQLYSIQDFNNILSVAIEVDYHKVKSEPVIGTSQKRLIEHIRSIYYKNSLDVSLPLHQLESLAIPFESYQLAYTADLVADIFDSKVDNPTLMRAKFTNSEGDDNWWIRSGTTQYFSDIENNTVPKSRFYVPISYKDPYGSKTSVRYYSNYYLFIKETEDEFKNKSSVDLFNFRTLSPVRMKDINGNISEAISDELGLVKALAVMGKGSEADDLLGLTEYTEQPEINNINDYFTTPNTSDGVTDSVLLISRAKALLQHATTRFIYDFEAYRNSGKPAVVCSIVREEHFKKNNDSPVQLSYEYSNGLGKVVMKKVQAEPGIAKKVIVHPNDSYSVTEEDTTPSGLLRWIGNGKTILNNKGNPVKQYEPYFSVSHKYEDFKELVETGVTPIMYYDAMSRLVKTEMPDGTFSKVKFDSWKQTVYDANDTVKDSQWYIDRINHSIDADLIAAGKDPEKEKIAAEKAAKHYNTPTTLHFDTLGRPVLSIDHNRNPKTGLDEFYKTKIKLDVEGNLRKVTDARELPENNNKGNVVMRYKYDMLGNLVYQNSMDAGKRLLLHNVLGNPFRTWDERDHEFRYEYDPLHRPTSSTVLFLDTQKDAIFDRIIYGESQLLPDRSNESALQQLNILGKPVLHYDTGGVIETPKYDFKGQPIFTTRKLFKEYRSVANWTDANILLDLEVKEFRFTTETDALGRITKQTAPDQSIIYPSYNEAGLLNSEKVTHFEAAVTTAYIKNIDYNEKGQRSKITYGNDVTTTFYYDEQTFRLKRLNSRRLNGTRLQDLYYTYDPVGNITHIRDKKIPTIYYKNQAVRGVSEYTYDALYRLIKAKGRENNAALTFGIEDNWKDTAFIHEMNPTDTNVLRNYTQRYEYDEVGNITRMSHQATGNKWTRKYKYEDTNNRLKNTKVGNQTNGSLNKYKYIHHDKHGFISKMPHLEEMDWNFKEEIVKTIRQSRTDGGTPETTYYQYDGQGQRIRKITENAADSGNSLSKKEERIYISGYELYIKPIVNEGVLERVSLSLLDEGHRFVMAETRNNINDGTQKHLVRYQLHNHLGSASLELDQAAEVISYEEYHPYGTTAYQANNASIKATAKRYRYTGMERDEETGLEYHSARYYIPWLGRWVSSDPIGVGDGVNLFGYGGNNPILNIDLQGKQANSNFGANVYHHTLSEIIIKKAIYNDEAVTAVSRVITQAEYSSGEGNDLKIPNLEEDVSVHQTETTVFIDGKGNIVFGTTSYKESTYSPADNKNNRIEHIDREFKLELNKFDKKTQEFSVLNSKGIIKIDKPFAMILEKVMEYNKKGPDINDVISREIAEEQEDSNSDLLDVLIDIIPEGRILMKLFKKVLGEALKELNSSNEEKCEQYLNENGMTIAEYDLFTVDEQQPQNRTEYDTKLLWTGGVSYTEPAAELGSKTAKLLTH